MHTLQKNQEHDNISRNKSQRGRKDIILLATLMDFSLVFWILKRKKKYYICQLLIVEAGYDDHDDGKEAWERKEQNRQGNRGFGLFCFVWNGLLLVQEFGLEDIQDAFQLYYSTFYGLSRLFSHSVAAER